MVFSIPVDISPSNNNKKVEIRIKFARSAYFFYIFLKITIFYPPEGMGRGSGTQFQVG